MWTLISYTLVFNNFLENTMSIVKAQQIFPGPNLEALLRSVRSRLCQR